ncbi:MAG TPA: HlyD family efflux transporter periplasmic adaptor subunit [Bryobacteraceae bacterium]|jgi:HlyD family secretion protein|nr:HlyD family efflux transporter periplasmic adaptor subunit [Bryobacteraceae bacterium]
MTEETKQPAEKPTASAPPQRKRRNPLPLIIVVLGVAAFFIWRGYFANPKVPGNLVTLSGRIEGDDSAVSPKTAGRIIEIRVREGDSVKAGDTIAVLDDAQIRAREEQAKAALAGAEARVKAATDQIAVYQQQLQQNELMTEQSKVDAGGRVKQAEADVAAAEADVAAGEADLAQQEASLKLAQFDNDAYQKLVKTGAASERQGKQASTTADQQSAAVAASRRRLESTRRRLEAARGSLTTAQANLSNPGIRSFQADAVRKQINQQDAEIASANAAAQQARFQLTEAQDNRNDLTITAPFDGTVMTRAAEPGEVVQAGTAIVTLLDMSKVYLRGFVPEGQIGKVKIGQPGHVYLDSAPDKAIDAVVQRIDPQATFTPENTYFRDDRVKQVVGVKLLLKSATGFAKPGMPSDGEILVDGNTWPAGRFNK